MTKGDDLVERAAGALQRAATNAAAEGGWKAKLAEPLAEDAAFLRQLKPSLIRARARGELPKDRAAGEGSATPAPLAPPGPQLGRRPSKDTDGGAGPNPFAVVGAALVLGILLAKMIDWRGHAHPRR
ncbi:MAG: hypothetical protein H0V40_09520 [Actinobacteria bacterium]|nr:hypothetical protein [Actinomycetota bacterium]